MSILGEYWEERYDNMLTEKNAEIRLLNERITAMKEYGDQRFIEGRDKALVITAERVGVRYREEVSPIITPTFILLGKTAKELQP